MSLLGRIKIHGVNPLNLHRIDQGDAALQAKSRAARNFLRPNPVRPTLHQPYASTHPGAAGARCATAQTRARGGARWASRGGARRDSLGPWSSATCDRLTTRLVRPKRALPCGRSTPIGMSLARAPGDGRVTVQELLMTQAGPGCKKILARPPIFFRLLCKLAQRHGFERGPARGAPGKRPTGSECESKFLGLAPGAVEPSSLRAIAVARLPR
jgi:hypothetical protein